MQKSEPTSDQLAPDWWRLGAQSHFFERTLPPIIHQSLIDFKHVRRFSYETQIV